MAKSNQSEENPEFEIQISQTLSEKTSVVDLENNEEEKSFKNAFDII